MTPTHLAVFVDRKLKLREKIAVLLGGPDPRTCSFPVVGSLARDELEGTFTITWNAVGVAAVTLGADAVTVDAYDDCTEEE